MRTYFKDKEGNLKPWLFPQLLDITRRWLAECVTCKDNTFPQLLLLSETSHQATDLLYQSIVTSDAGQKTLLPILQPYNTIGSTQYVDFDTSRPVYATRPEYSHISHVVCDTESWEQKMAQALEELGDEGMLLSYAKNHNLSFDIPYTFNGEEHMYRPDFLVRLKLPDGKDQDGILNLIVEVSGLPKKDKAVKVATARNLWVTAVNNHGGFGRWAFLEISDPWDAKNTIRTALGAMRPRPS